MKKQIIQNKRDEIAFVQACLLDIDNAADGVDLGDRQAEWDAGVAFLGSVEDKAGALHDLSVLEARAEIAAQAAAGRAVHTDAPVFHRQPAPIDVATADRGTVRDGAMRAIEAAHKGFIPTATADALELAINRGNSSVYSSDQVAATLVATSAPAYQSAFIKGINGQSHLWSNEEREAYRTASNASSTDAEGGFGIPTVIDPTVILTSGSTGQALVDAARVVPVTAASWNGLNAAGAAWSMDAEGAEVSEDTPTFSQPSVDMEKAQAWIDYTVELGQDFPSWAREVGRILTNGYLSLVATQAAVGTGSSPQTTGIFTGATTTVDVATTDTFVAADIDSIFAAVAEDWRSRGSWVMDVTVENAIRAFGSNESRFTVDQTASGITLLNGKPVILSDAAPDLAVTTDAADILVFGDLDHFIIGQRMGMTLKAVDVVMGANQRPTGKSGLYATARFGTGVVNTSAIKKLKNITT